MSARLMVRAIELDLPEGLKLLLIALARYAADDGTKVYPSIAKLTDQLGKDRRTIERRMAKLRALGILQVEAQGGGQHRTTRYRIEVPATPAGASGFAPAGIPAPASAHPGAGVAEPRQPRRATPAPAPGDRSMSRSESGQGGSAREANGSHTTPETPALAYLASVGATVQPDGNGYHRTIVRLAKRHGAEKLIDAMQLRHAAGDRTGRQLIFGAANALEPVAGGVKDARRLDAAEEDRKYAERTQAQMEARRRAAQEWIEEPAGRPA